MPLVFFTAAGPRRYAFRGEGRSGAADGTTCRARGAPPTRHAADGGVATGGYARACGGRGLLEGIATAVGRLAGFLEAAGPAGVCYDAWARAVRRVSATL